MSGATRSRTDRRRIEAVADFRDNPRAIGRTHLPVQYYFSIDGNNQQGPVDRDRLIAAGVTARTQVWREGLSGWMAAVDVPELAELFNAPATEQYAMEPAPVQPQYQSAQPTVASPVQYQSYQANMAQPANGMAVASLVLGIVGVASMCVYGFGLIPGILAIIFGHMSRAQIRRGLGSGDGLAHAGMIMGYISVLLVVVLIVIAIGFAIVFSATALNASPRAPVFVPAVPRQPGSIPGPNGVLFDVLLLMLPL